MGWTDAWRNQNPLLRIILEDDPTGPSGRPRMRWRDPIKNNVEKRWRIGELEGTNI